VGRAFKTPFFTIFYYKKPFIVCDCSQQTHETRQQQTIAPTTTKTAKRTSVIKRMGKMIRNPI
jgi:hypothetical protein